MSNKGRSEKNIFGGYTHYDEKGRKIGESNPNIFGGYNNYDAKGRKIGESDPNIFGGYTQRDNRGRKIGESDPNIFGGYTHYDTKGRKVGESDRSPLGGYRHTDNQQGCYIATCIYGSYDCPEVWVLRRFRDSVLAKTLPGRAFIRTYYAISPGLVRMFGAKSWFRIPWKRFLDKMVLTLREKGISDKPYQDCRKPGGNMQESEDA